MTGVYGQLGGILRGRARILGAGVLVLLVLLGVGLWGMRPAVHEFTVPQGFAGGVDHRADQPVRAHCQAHFDAGQRDSGFYKVRGPLISALPVYCRMEKGRGLTLVMYGAQPYAAKWNTTDAIYPVTAPQAAGRDNYKLSDAVITYLATSQGALFRFEQLDANRAWEMKAAAYNHVGFRADKAVQCTTYLLQNPSEQTGAGSGAQTSVRYSCAHARRGIAIKQSHPNPHLASQWGSPGMYPNPPMPLGVARTNDFAIPDDKGEVKLTGSHSGAAEAGWFKRLFCRIKYGDPDKPIELLEDLFDYMTCVNAAEIALMREDRSSFMHIGAQVALYIAYQPAQAAQFQDGEVDDVGER